jgi:hypothetical protein
VSVGAFIIDRGILLRQRGALILQRDDGRHWKLLCDADVEHLVGSSVRVEGLKIDGETLELTRTSATY